MRREPKDLERRNGSCDTGIGLYFRQLLSLAALCTVYGLITMPTLVYYASNKYDPNSESMVMFAGVCLTGLHPLEQKLGTR